MARPGQPAKEKRNQELIRVRDQAGLSFERIGKTYGISKQAAWAIYQRGTQKPQNQREPVLTA